MLYGFVHQSKHFLHMKHCSYSGLVFYLLKLSPTIDNTNYIINYMASLSIHEHLEEVLDLTYNAIKSSANSSLCIHLAGKFYSYRNLGLYRLCIGSYSLFFICC